MRLGSIHHLPSGLPPGPLQGLALPGVGGEGNTERHVVDESIEETHRLARHRRVLDDDTDLVVDVERPPIEVEPDIASPAEFLEFDDPRFGKGAANAMILLLILVVFLVVYASTIMKGAED